MKPHWCGASRVMGARAEAGQKDGLLDFSERYLLAAGLCLSLRHKPPWESSGSGAEAQTCRGLGLNHTAPCFSQQLKPFWEKGYVICTHSNDKSSCSHNSESCCLHFASKKTALVTQLGSERARIRTQVSQLPIFPPPPTICHCVSV